MFDKEIYEKLSRYCAYQERCTADVTDKLYKLKVPKDEFDKYLPRLKADNFLNDERYIKYFVAAHTKKKWGKNKIKAALAAKHLSGALLKQYLDDIDDDNYKEQITTLLQRKWGTLKTGTFNEKKVKLMRFLLSKGFEMDKVNAAIKAANLTS